MRVLRAHTGASHGNHQTTAINLNPVCTITHQVQYPIYGKSESTQHLGDPPTSASKQSRVRLWIVADNGVKTHSLMTRHLVWPDSASDRDPTHIQAYTDKHMYNIC